MDAPKSKKNPMPPASNPLGDRMTDVSGVSMKISGKWISLVTGKEVHPKFKTGK